MISLMQLWAPIVLSAVLVFVASSLIHMVFKWHNSDYHKLPNEDEVRAAMRQGNPEPGQYVVPYCTHGKEMQSPEMVQKFTEGPNGMFFVRPNGPPAMGGSLGAWFGLNLAVSFMVAYVASRSLGEGTSYLQVFRFVGTICFMTYAGGAISDAIWMGKPWRSAFKDLLDALIYGLVSAGAFGWLWPR